MAGAAAVSPSTTMNLGKNRARKQPSQLAGVGGRRAGSICVFHQDRMTQRAKDLVFATPAPPLLSLPGVAIITENNLAPESIYLSLTLHNKAKQPSTVLVRGGPPRPPPRTHLTRLPPLPHR